MLLFPPRNNNAEFQETVQALLDWLHDILGRLGTRTTPTVAMDLNDGLGIQQNSLGNWSTQEDPFVGTQEPQHEHLTSSKLRTLLEAHSLCAISTFWKTGPTYYGEHSSTKIDHYLIPCEARHSARQLHLL